MLRVLRVLGLLTVVALVCGGSRAAEEDVPGLAAGTEAPALQGSKWITADGKAPELKGKVYLIDFWFADCISCVHAVPTLKKLAADYGPKGLLLVGAALDGEETVRKFREEHKLSYPLLAAAEKSVAAYGVQAYPTMFLVGKDGRILWKGQIRDDVFEQRVEKALAGK